MLSNTVTITKPSDTITDQVPADIYQIALTDVSEVDGTDYQTHEPIKQFKFIGKIVDEGDYQGKVISFFTSPSWFNGGKSSKPSKLFNLYKTVYAFYDKAKKPDEIPVITAEDVNGMVGKQIRVTTEVNKNGWPKVTSFTTIKKEIPVSGNEDVDPDEVDL